MFAFAPEYENSAARRIRRQMNPARWILVLFLIFLAWVPLSIYLAWLSVQNQDAAGKGIYSILATMFLLLLGALALGIPALVQARQHKAQLHFCVRALAWLILLSPLLIAGGAILTELIGDLFRSR
jgi:hypothetical protein